MNKLNTERNKIKKIKNKNSDKNFLFEMSIKLDKFWDFLKCNKLFLFDFHALRGGREMFKLKQTRRVVQL